MDAWEILGQNHAVTGRIQSDNGMLALMRRYLANINPQMLKFRVDDSNVGLAKQTWIPFLIQMRVDFTADTSKKIDRWLGLAAVELLQGIEAGSSKADSTALNDRSLIVVELFGPGSRRRVLPY